MQRDTDIAMGRGHGLSDFSERLGRPTDSEPPLEHENPFLPSVRSSPSSPDVHAGGQSVWHSRVHGSSRADRGTLHKHCMQCSSASFVARFMCEETGSSGAQVLNPFLRRAMPVLQVWQRRTEACDLMRGVSERMQHAEQFVNAILSRWPTRMSRRRRPRSRRVADNSSKADKSDKASKDKKSKRTRRNARTDQHDVRLIRRT